MIGTRRCNAWLSATERVGFVTRLNYPHMHIAKEVAICKFMWRLQHVRNAWALMRSCLGLWLVMRQCINHLALKTDLAALLRLCSYADTTLFARSFYKPSAPVSHTDNGHSEKPKKNKKKQKQIRKRKQTVAATATTTTTVTATAKEAQQQQQ